MVSVETATGGAPIIITLPTAISCLGRNTLLKNQLMTLLPLLLNLTQVATP